MTNVTQIFHTRTE